MIKPLLLHANTLECFDDVLDQLKKEYKIIAIVSDPPYNINHNTNYADRYNGGNEFYKIRKKVRRGALNWEKIENKQKIDFSFLFKDDYIRDYCLFGANNYIEYLPNYGYDFSISTWDKRSNEKADFEMIKKFDNMFGSCFELIYFYPKKNYDFCRFRFTGFYGTETQDIRVRVHPTQKPLEVMDWCIKKMKLKAGTLIFDPFMGSGSTGVAAIKLDYPFCGIELNDGYFDIANKRIMKFYNKAIEKLI